MEESRHIQPQTSALNPTPLLMGAYVLVRKLSIIIYTHMYIEYYIYIIHTPIGNVQAAIVSPGSEHLGWSAVHLKLPDGGDLRSQVAAGLD